MSAVCGPIASIPAAASLDQVREYVRASKADNTLRGYTSDWRDFCAWCESHGRLCPLGAEADTVAAYIAECAGGSAAKFIFEPFSGRHDVMKSLEIGHLVKIIKHCLCFEGSFRNGTLLPGLGLSLLAARFRLLAAHRA